MWYTVYLVNGTNYVVTDEEATRILTGVNSTVKKMAFVEVNLHSPERERAGTVRIFLDHIVAVESKV